MARYIQIEGMIETPDDIDCDALMDLFLGWLENDNESYFAGSYFQADENGDIINNELLNPTTNT